MEEPFTPAPRSCSTPHPAPVAWLKACPQRADEYDPGILPPPADLLGPPEQAEPAEPAAAGALTPEEQRRRDIDGFLAAYEGIAPEAERRDGWTPFTRKLFLQVIAETGKIGLACAYTGMSRSAAYALAARDRVFAVGWDAAAHFARQPLADDNYEKARDGFTETITRSDGAVVTRHRFDSRLAMAVLNRLDRRCDRAEEQGAIHLAAVRNWGDYLNLIGEGEDQAAEALLGNAPDCPTCPLPERKSPIPVPDPPGYDPGEHVWQTEEGVWMTTFPPPPGFGGHENRPWDGFNYYERECTAEEAELLDANAAAAEAEEYAENTAHAEAERDAWFEKLRAELSGLRHPGLDPGPAFPSAAEKEQGLRDDRGSSSETNADPGSRPG